MPKAKFTLVGPDAATVEPLVIRPGDTTQLVFKAQLVNNKVDENMPVKGALVWQRRKPSEKGHEWADEATLEGPTRTHVLRPSGPSPGPPTPTARNVYR